MNKEKKRKYWGNIVTLDLPMISWIQYQDIGNSASGCGSSGSVLVWQVQGLEFKPQYCQKTQATKEIIYK
jgi:hypothetical protein